jgi:hypothetical protein
MHLCKNGANPTCNLYMPSLPYWKQQVQYLILHPFFFLLLSLIFFRYV